MPADNTLGAPTEGLGQTVTFAIGGGRGTPQTTGDQRGALRSGVSGNGVQRTAQALQVQQATPDPTFQALAKMGGAILQPHIEQERQAKYWEGVQKASNQQAITEIVDEQPWYSKIFGSTSLVDGARAHTASSKASQLAAQIEEDMVNLRSKSPSEFAQHVAKLVQSANTGDQATDIMLSAQLAQTLPPVMKGQVKAHIRFKQEQLDLSRDSALTSAFTLLGSADAQTRQPDPTKEQADTLGVGLRAMELMRPLPEEDPKHFNKLLAGSAVKAILNGNFAVATLLQSTEVYKTMSAAEQQAIHHATAQARSDARMKLPISFAEDLSALQRLSNDPSVRKEDIPVKVAEFNSKYTQHTGDPESYFRTENVAQEISQWQANQDHLLAQAAARTRAATTKAEKDAAALDEQAAIASSMVQGGYVKDKPLEDRRSAWALAEQKLAGQPEVLARARVVQASMDNPDTAYADKFQSAILLAAGAYDPKSGSPAALHQMYQEYVKLQKAGGNEGLFAAQKYAGEGGKLMQAYDSIAHGRILGAADIQTAYAHAVTTAAKPPSKLTPEQQKQLEKRFTDGVTDKLYNAFASDSFNVRDPKGLSEALAPYVRTDVPMEVAADLAFNMAKADGKIGALAGYHWPVLAGATNFSAALGKDINVVPADARNKAFANAVDVRAKESGLQNVAQVGQWADSVTGDPQIYVMGTGEGNKIVTTFFTAREAAAMWKQKQETVTLAPLDLTTKAQQEAAYKKNQAYRASLPERLKY